MPGKPDDSLLFVAVTWKDPELEMPPERERSPLGRADRPRTEVDRGRSSPGLGPELEKRLDGRVGRRSCGMLRAMRAVCWSRRVGDFHGRLDESPLRAREDLWAFQPVKPAVVPVPEDALHPIDAFVERAGSTAARMLSPAPPADRQER